MRRRRSGRSDRELTSGPGKLTRALAIGPELQRHPLNEAPLFIAAGQATPRSEIIRTPRIGVSKGVDTLWRFYDRRSDWVSRRARERRGTAVPR